MVLVNPPSKNSACSIVHLPHFMSSSLQPAAFPPVLDGKPVYLYQSLVKGWQLAKQPLQAAPPLARVIWMECLLGAAEGRWERIGSSALPPPRPELPGRGTPTSQTAGVPVAGFFGTLVYLLTVTFHVSSREHPCLFGNFITLCF